MYMSLLVFVCIRNSNTFLKPLNIKWSLITCGQHKDMYIYVGLPKSGNSQEEKKNFKGKVREFYFEY